MQECKRREAGREGEREGGREGGRDYLETARDALPEEIAKG
jgi:hypothetical protein